MQQHRLTPSALLVIAAFAGTACTVASIESAAAPEVRAVDAPDETAAPTPLAPTTVAPTTLAPTTVGATRMTAAVEPDPVVTIAPVIALDPCGPVGPIPDSAAALTSIGLDVAGDGTVDDIASSYLDGDSGEWRIRLATADGVTSEQVVAGVGPGFVEVLGAVEFGSSGADSFLATIGSSPSSLRLGLFGADSAGCLVHHGGAALDFAVGGTIGGYSGVRCDSWEGDHFLESLGAVEVGPGAYNVYGTTVHLDADDGTFAESGTHLFGVTADEAQQVATIECPGFG